LNPSQKGNSNPFSCLPPWGKAEGRQAGMVGRRDWERLCAGAAMLITGRIAVSAMRTRITVGRTRMRISALAIQIEN